MNLLATKQLPLSSMGKNILTANFTNSALANQFFSKNAPKDASVFGAISRGKIIQITRILYLGISEIGLIREISGSDSFWFWLVQVRISIFRSCDSKQKHH